MSTFEGVPIKCQFTYKMLLQSKDYFTNLWRNMQACFLAAKEFTLYRKWLYTYFGDHSWEGKKVENQYTLFK